YKKEESVALLSDDLNDLLNNEEAQQSKSKGAKRGHKKKQDTVAPPASKIIIDLLNDDDGSTKDLNKDKQNENSQNDDKFIFLTRMTVSDLRANNPIDQINDIPSNRLILLELRNKITPSNSTSKMILAIPDSRVNSPFGHITSRILRPRLIPLSPRDNMMNIVNNSHNISNASQYNFNMNDEGIPLPFNKMMIYQLCLWLCMNPNILQLANNMHLSMQMPVVDGLHFIPSTTPGTLIMPQDQGIMLEELIWKVTKCELNSAKGIE
ncbi:hypothetical protein C1645_840796, partial [Glomus cerebriforme]